MFPWERRLRDLAQILENCERAYFEPELYRMNTNQFLQTARTVTFLIQSNKSKVLNFDAWYQASIRDPWAKDLVMTWARDARNTIEKVGDLELHSSLNLSLIFSYLSEEDIEIPCSRDELVGAGIKFLSRFARQRLPSSISDVALIKIERRWVANSLPSWELHNALVYIYARLFDGCSALAKHMGHQLPDSIRQSTDFDQTVSDAKKIRYAKLNRLGLAQLKSHDTNTDLATFKVPQAFEEVVEKHKSVGDTRSISENVQLFSEIAKATFEHFGSHDNMLFLFDESGKPVSFIGTQFEDQADKYIFWRAIAERVVYLKAASMIWVAEAWQRDVAANPLALMRNMPITGEFLNVVGFDYKGQFTEVSWDIVRRPGQEKPELRWTEPRGNIGVWQFLAPVRKALAKVWGPQTTERSSK